VECSGPKVFSSISSARRISGSASESRLVSVSSWRQSFYFTITMAAYDFVRLPKLLGALSAYRQMSLHSRCAPGSMRRVYANPQSNVCRGTHKMSFRGYFNGLLVQYSGGMR
jgi:hypothetical protein